MIVVGVARDCARALPGTYLAIERAFAGFGRRKWFIVESDSSDATVDVLRQLASGSPDFQFASLGNLRDHIPSRTERIAQCRNAYLNAVRTRPDWADASMIAVADL